MWLPFVKFGYKTSLARMMIRATWSTCRYLSSHMITFWDILKAAMGWDTLMSRYSNIGNSTYSHVSSILVRLLVPDTVESTRTSDGLTPLTNTIHPIWICISKQTVEVVRPIGDKLEVGLQIELWQLCPMLRWMRTILFLVILGLLVWQLILKASNYWC